MVSIMLGHRLRAQRHSDDQWNGIKSRFRELYQGQRRPLVEVRQILKDELKFDATERQYKRRIKYWGLRKNATSEDYSRVESLLSGPNSHGVEDIASSTGIPMTDKKIRRYVKSRHRHALESKSSQASPFASSAIPTQQQALPSGSLEQNQFTPYSDDIESFPKLFEYQFHEPSAEYVPTSIVCPDLEDPTATSWLLEFADYQVPQADLPQLGDLSTMTSQVETNNSTSWDVAGEGRFHIEH